VGVEIVAETEYAPSQGVAAGPPLDGQILEVGQGVFGPRRAELPAQGQPTQCRDDLEVQQRRRVQLLAGQVGAQILAALYSGERVDHRRAIDDDHALARRVSRLSRSPRDASKTSTADAVARSARRAARSSTSATVGRATSRLIMSSK